MTAADGCVQSSAALAANWIATNAWPTYLVATTRFSALGMIPRRSSRPETYRVDPTLYLPSAVVVPATVYVIASTPCFAPLLAAPPQVANHAITARAWSMVLYSPFAGG